MVDAVLTVKGYFTLAAIYDEEATMLERGGVGALADDGQYIDLCRSKAQTCRERAYDLLGVVTLPTNQLPLMTTNGEVVL